MLIYFILIRHDCLYNSNKMNEKGGGAMDYYAIGQRIRKFRKAHDWSQEELAEKVEISTTHMSHIETGSTKLSLPVLVSLANVLDVRTDDLLFDRTQDSHNAAVSEITEILSQCTTQQVRFLGDLIRASKTAMKQYCAGER